VGFTTYASNEVGMPFKVTYKWKIGDDGPSSEDFVKDVDLSTIQDFTFKVMLED
jgi:hypothetical protein